jgi:endonuclease YncB( thermonuclease family)
MSRIATALALFLLLLSFTTLADTLTGTVSKVVDGDTIHLLTTNQTRHKIRLAGIDAPERGQAFGTKSKEHLATLVAGERVEVQWAKHDRYKRIIGKITRAGEDVNLEMVRAGLAWWYRKYAHEQSLDDQRVYAAAEDEARHGRVGLWRDPNPVPPWSWRRR